MRGPRSFAERKESASRKSERTIAEGRAAGTRSPSEGQAASEARECPAPSPFPGSFSDRSVAGSVASGRAGPEAYTALALPSHRVGTVGRSPRRQRGPREGKLPRRAVHRTAWRPQQAAAVAATSIPAGKEAPLVRERPLHHRLDPSRGSGGVSGDRGPYPGAKRAGGRAGWRASAQESEAQNGCSRTPGSCQTGLRSEGVYVYRPAPPNVRRTPPSSPREADLPHPRAPPLIGCACGPYRLPYSG